MKVFFSVGEPSGDLHGSNLIRDLKQAYPQLQPTGFGGPKMQDQGQDQLFDLTSMAVMFLGDVIRNYSKFRNLISQAKNYFDNNRVDAVVLIDYPGFNWHIAKAAKERGIPVFYYGVPQMWAWASWRIKKIKRYVDHVLCKLPFEKDWFAERNCRATYVGHPYFDEISRRKIDGEFVANTRRENGSLITLLPGSRDKEIRNNLPALLDTASLVQKEIPSASFAVAAFNDRHREWAQEMIQQRNADIPVFVKRTPELIESAKCCLACSGSVSLELLAAEKPTVIHFKISNLLNFLQRRIVKSKYITLVNLLWTKNIQRTSLDAFDPDAKDAERVPYPEYLTNVDKSPEMAAHLIHWLTDESEYNRRVEELHLLKSKYANAGASQKAANYIASVLGGSNSALPENSAAPENSVAPENSDGNSESQSQTDQAA